MIVKRSMDSRWLSNSYLIVDSSGGGSGVIIDTGAPTTEIENYIDQNSIQLTHILCTHHHGDHVQYNDHYRNKYNVPVCVPKGEANLFPNYDEVIKDGEKITSGNLTIEAIHTPGHTVGMLAFIINNEALFTGDTLFRDSVGGTLAPGHGTIDELKHSIMDVLLKLPHDLTVYPGHTEQTTLADEWGKNAFIRAWRGKDSVVETACEAFGKPATLLLRAPDYDGGTKCWIRLNGTEQIAPGSKVTQP